MQQINYDTFSMGKHNYNKVLLEVIRRKLPREITSVAFLMDVLCIGKEAAYRRLRGEVFLTLEEVARLARVLDISIDAVLGTGSERISSYRMCMAEFENPTQADYRILEEYVELICCAKDDPLSQLSVSANMLPQQLYLQYEHLTRFFMFKKAYHDTPRQVKAYHQVVIPYRMQRVFRDSFEAHRQFKTLHFVFDRDIFMYLVHNIRYFQKIELISKQEVDIVRQDILKMINDLEQTAINGTYNNGAKVYLYISNINFDKNCYNIKIQDHYINIIEAYILNGVASTDKADYDRMEEWFLSQYGLSTMISMCGEPQRFAFFNRQRSVLETLIEKAGSPPE